MKTHNYAHAAAEEYYEKHDRMDEFEYWGSPEDLIEAGILVRKPKRHSSGHNYVLIHGDLWFIFSSDGSEQVAGPFENKSGALRFAGEETSSYEDAGLYTLSDDRYVARREVAIERGFNVEPPPEVEP